MGARSRAGGRDPARRAGPFPTMLTATLVGTVNVPGRYATGAAASASLCSCSPRRHTQVVGPERAHRRRSDLREALETPIAIHAENRKDRARSEHRWRASLRDHAMPRLADRPVDEIDTADVMAAGSPSGPRRAGGRQARPAAHRRGDEAGGRPSLQAGQPGGRRHLGRAAENAVPQQHQRPLRTPRSGRRSTACGDRGRTAAPCSRSSSSCSRLPQRRGPRHPMGRVRHRRGGLDDSRRAHEGGQGAPRAGGVACARSPRRGAPSRRTARACLPVPDREDAEPVHRAVAAVRPGDRRGAARLPVRLSGLGRRMHGPSARSLRTGARARQQRAGGGRVPPARTCSRSGASRWRTGPPTSPKRKLRLPGLAPPEPGLASRRRAYGLAHPKAMHRRQAAPIGMRRETASQCRHPCFPKNHSAGSSAAQVPAMPGGPCTSPALVAACQAA